MIKKYVFAVLVWIPLICFSETTKELRSLANLAARGDQIALQKLIDYSKDNKDAAKLLGILYFQGRGVEKNQEKGISYLENSAALGDVESKSFLIKLYLKKDGKFYSREKASNLRGTSTAPNSDLDEDVHETLTNTVRWRPFVEPIYNKKSTGSAFAINPTGIFVTNHHVIKGCTQIVVNYNENRSYANLIANSEDKDLAVIGVNQKSPYFLKLKNQPISIGENVSVGGYPLDGWFKYSDGIVAAIPLKNKVLQISASISSGNSGGPVVDKNGGVVGVIVSVLPPGKMSSGDVVVGADYNFAIDAQILKKILNTNSISFFDATNTIKNSSQRIANLLEKTTARIDCY
jgi:S1-C subfamily serine protease